MRTERLLIDTVVLSLLGVMLFAAGWLAAPTIFEAAVSASGVHELVLESPVAIVETYPGIAVAFAIAAPLAWIVGGAYRVGAHRAPSVPLLVVVVLLLLASTIFGMAHVVWFIADALQSEQELPMMISPGTFELGDRGAGMACRLALLLTVLAFALGRRAKQRA